MDSVLEVLAGSCLRGVVFLEEVLAVVLEGCGIFYMQCFGGVWHFWRVLFSVMEGCGIFGECFGGMTFWKRRL